MHGFALRFLHKHMGGGLNLHLMCVASSIEMRPSWTWCCWCSNYVAFVIEVVCGCVLSFRVCVCVCVEIVFECDVMCLWLCWCCVVGAWPLSLSLLQVSVVLMHASFRALCCVAIVVGCLSSPLHASGMFLHAGFRA